MKVNIPAGKSIAADDLLGENQCKGPQSSTSRGHSAKNKFSKKGKQKNEERLRIYVHLGK
jgi:hypothetical protein